MTRASGTRRRHASKSTRSNLRARVTCRPDECLPRFTVVLEKKGGRLRANGRVTVRKQHAVGEGAGARKDGKCCQPDCGVGVGKPLPRGSDGRSAAESAKRFHRFCSDGRVWIVEHSDQGSFCGLRVEVSQRMSREPPYPRILVGE